MELELLQQKIYEIRGQRVMLDYDLADLYEVETKVMNQAVKRNTERFPDRFMFRLTKEDWLLMRSQFVTASTQNKRNSEITPFAFTEHGVTMLASVLKSKKAIAVNIAIIDAFLKLKEFANNYLELSTQLKKIETKYDKQFDDIFEAINYLLKKDNQIKQQAERKKIGFKSDKL